MKKIWIILASILFLAGCSAGGPADSGGGGAATAQVGTAAPGVGGGTVSTPLPAGTPEPLPTLAGGLGATELKYRLLDEFPLFFCDPDEYPISRGDETEKALERFAEIEANREEFNAILAHTGLPEAGRLSDEQKLQVYREHKRLGAIVLTPEGETAYRFQLQSAEREGNGEILTGIIDGSGKITVQERQQTIATCPICLAEGTRIDTPAGPVAVEDLRPGDVVWTLTAGGRKTAARLAAVGRAPVPEGHRVVRLVLDDGRALRVSPGHPTADGRTAGDLRPGDPLDGSRVLSANLEAYTGAYTYDILPDGETGVYLADGIWMGSTMRK